MLMLLCGGLHGCFNEAQPLGLGGGEHQPG